MRSTFAIRMAVVLAILAPLVWFLDCEFRFWALWAQDAPSRRSALTFLHRPVEGTGWIDVRLLPAWYLAPSYAMLRAIDFGLGPADAKLLGVITAYAAALGPLSLALYDWRETPVRAWFSLLALSPILVGLGWSAWQPPEGDAFVLSQVLTACYFALFFVVFPVLALRRGAPATLKQTSR